jgi:hypothetical protein
MFTVFLGKALLHIFHFLLENMHVLSFGHTIPEIVNVLGVLAATNVTDPPVVERHPERTNVESRYHLDSVYC